MAAIPDRYVARLCSFVFCQGLYTDDTYQTEQSRTRPDLCGMCDCGRAIVEVEAWWFAALEVDVGIHQDRGP